MSVKRDLGIELRIGLGFSLNSGEVPIGVNFSTVDQLNREIDGSPPSMYLLSEGMLGPEGKEIPWAMLRLGPSDVRCYYLEFLTTVDRDHRRSFWLVGT